MDSLGLYHQSVRILKFNSILVGMEIWNPTKLLTFGSYTIMIQMVIYFWCNFWTVYKYRHDMIYVMEVLNCAGMAFQLSVKFFIALLKKTMLFKLCQQVENDLYLRYPTRNTPEGEIVYKYAQRFNMVLKVLVFLYCSTLPVFALYPLFIYVTEGKLIPLFMFEVSYVDWHTTGGYILTNVVHVLTYVMGICGMILADGLFLVTTIHGLMYMEIFMIHMEQLGELVHSDKDKKHEQQIDSLWKDCILEHQHIAEYFSDIEDFSGKVCLVLVFTVVFAICDNLVLCVLTDWYASYLFLLVCFVQLTIYFVTGNLVELMFGKTNLCINNFPYYLMKAVNQKQYLFMVRRMLKPFTLTVCGFSGLNFESYMTILKILYQFAMMIFNFLA